MAVIAGNALSGADTHDAPAPNEVRIPKGAPVYDSPNADQPCGNVAYDVNGAPLGATALHDGLVRFADGTVTIEGYCGNESWIHLPNGLDDLPPSQ